MPLRESFTYSIEIHLYRQPRILPFEHWIVAVFSFGSHGVRIPRGADSYCCAPRHIIAMMKLGEYAIA